MSSMFKVKAFAFGSAALGLAGALYGHYTSYIAPDIFVPLLTLYIKLALLVGGVGNNRGAVVGAVARRDLPGIDAFHHRR